MDFTTAYSRSTLDMIATSLRRYVGKLNRPKASANLTSERIKTLILGFRGQNLNRLDE